MKFFVREILDATLQSRVASQFGAQKGDRASNRLTRRPATHNPNPIHAHVPTRLRIVCEKFTLVAVACSRTVRGRAWSQTRAVRGRAHLRGLNMIADCSRTQTVCVRSLCATGPHTRLRTGCGQFVSFVVDSSWTRPFAWTERGRGLFADPDESCPWPACGQFAFAD